MKQVLVSKQTTVENYSCPTKTGSEIKNPLPKNMHGICAMDLIGLSWIFLGEDDVLC